VTNEITVICAAWNTVITIDLLLPQIGQELGMRVGDEERLGKRNNGPVKAGL